MIDTPAVPPATGRERGCDERREAAADGRGNLEAE